MKTIEEKAKAYDKVHKKIAIRFGSNVADEFFAEFEGSKDEEIRKALLEMVHDTTGDELWIDYNVHKENALAWLEKQGKKRKITHEEICKSYGIPDIGEFSDGYHTFNGLYKQRMILFAVLVKTYKDRAWKSWKHEDGLDCFGGGWFIVGIDTPAGTYTYHYEAKDWDRFDCQILEKAKHWDGHDESDVERLFSLVSNANKDEVIRCLINGMKFYYEDNEEATWGTQKFSMKVKDILSWLEKQGSLKDIIDRAKDSWYNEGKIAGMAEGLTDDEKYQQGWHDALENQGEKHPEPYNGISFEYNGHIWGMCARDNGVDISCDKHLIKHLEKQDEQEKDILEDAILDDYILDDDEDGLIAETIKYKHEKQDKQKLAENAKPQSSTPMSYGKELEKRMCEACNRFFAPNTDSNRYSASDLFYAGVKAERDLNTLTWSEEDVRVIDDIFYSINEESVTEGLNDRGIMYALKDIRGIVKYLRNWLQDLKRRVQPQPKQEWSKKDEAYVLLLDSICESSEAEYYDNPDSIIRKEIVNARLWLKSLRPRSTWKPSDEQISLLQAIINEPKNATSESCQIVLKDTLEQLKKLKKEQA